MLRQKLQADQIDALKSKNPVKLQTVRYILAQVKNKEIETKAELNDEQTLAILLKVKKEFSESVEAFTKGNRADLVAEYQAQLDVVNQYLPKELTDDEIKAAVASLLEKNRAAYEANPKSIIGIVMRELKGKADPGRIMNALRAATTV